MTGRIVGASVPGAYVYPLGRPDLKVDVQPDGSYRLEAVPTDHRSLVLYDGFPSPNGRAELVTLEIRGGNENPVADRYGAGATSVPSGLKRMPLAGTVLAAAMPDGGATPWQPRFDLPETVHFGMTPATGGAIPVFPLPAGTYQLSAALPGFTLSAVAVTVAAGMTSPAPVALPIDLAATAPGCGSVPADAPSRCENGLVCEPLDGRCYECVVPDDPHCTSGCDVATHLCKAPAASASTFCSPCSSSTDCGSSQVPNMYCRKSDDSTTGYCTRSGCSSEPDCPAGFLCSEGICRPPNGCGTWIQTMGATCYSSSSNCAYGLKNGWCQGAGDDHPGTCTASCRADVDCHVGTGFNSTYNCNLTASTPYCGP
ncbi:MAG: hypothetical protein WCC48_04190 [Anaeromyxobacteraceae bacterium]